jgi:hypothetical protein
LNDASRLSLLLLGLAGAGALFAFARTPRGELALEEAIVTAKKIGETVSNALQPRGIRNFNPGNLRWDGTIWQGLADPMYDAGKYLRFATPLDGLRALGRDLRTKHSKGLRTVRAIITKYAPPNENDTDAYIAAVVRRLFPHLRGDPVALERAADELVDVPRNLVAFMRAVVAHENGAAWEHHYTDSEYAEGARRALT